MQTSSVLNSYYETCLNYKHAGMWDDLFIDVWIPCLFRFTLRKTFPQIHYTIHCTSSGGVEGGGGGMSKTYK